MALKVVENRGNVDRLMLEPALLSKLRHPCIVRLDDYFLDRDRLVLALELIRARTSRSSWTATRGSPRRRCASC